MKSFGKYRKGQQSIRECCESSLSFHKCIYIYMYIVEPNLKSYLENIINRLNELSLIAGAHLEHHPLLY